MDLVEAVTLGFLQGVAEWLPISSQGLVTLVSKIVYGQSFERSLATAVWLHIGTLIAASIYLRNELAEAVSGIFKEGPGRRLLMFMAVATASTAATAVPILIGLRNLAIPDSIFMVSIGFLILSVSLIPRKSRKEDRIPKLDLKTAVIVGLIQGLSIVPGVSRSGVTMSTLLVLGFNLHNALKLSYLISIPAVLGAQISLPFLLGVREVGWENIVGAAVAMLSGLLTISFMLKVSLQHDIKIVAVPLAAFLIITGLLLNYGG